MRFIIWATISVLFSGILSYSLFLIFFKLVPWFVSGKNPIERFLLHWLLIICIHMPAILIALLGPLVLCLEGFNLTTTENERLGLFVSGAFLLVVCVIVGLRSPAGKRYLSWNT